jgi:hypothetical protein
LAQYITKENKYIAIAERNRPGRGKLIIIKICDTYGEASSFKYKQRSLNPLSCKVRIYSSTMDQSI